MNGFAVNKKGSIGINGKHTEKRIQEGLFLEGNTEQLARQR